MMIAERIGCSPSEAKWKTPAGEFIRWQLRFQREWNESDKNIWHLAQIAYELARLTESVQIISSFFGQIPEFKRTVQEFILKFNDKIETEPEEVIKEKKDQAQLAKVRRSQAALKAKMNSARPKLPKHAADILARKKGK